MKRQQAVNLYGHISRMQSAPMKPEAMKSFWLMRLKLRPVFVEYEKVHTEINDATRPAGWKPGDNDAAWKESYNLLMNAWLDEEIQDVETKVLTEDEFRDAVSTTVASLGILDYLFENLVKL